MLKMKEMPLDERPYEKCELYGPGVLSDAELLAVVIRTGTAKKRSVEVALDILKLSETGDLKGLYTLTPAQLKKVSGIGRVKAIQIQCVLELSKRIHSVKPDEKAEFVSPSAIADYYMETMRHYQREQLLLIMLNAKNRKIADKVLSMGSVNYALVSPRDIFLEALRHDAVHIILVHNHPSGDPTPSAEDIEMTKRVSQMGQMLGIDLLDHIIMGDGIFYSLLEHGHLQE